MYRACFYTTRSTPHTNVSLLRVLQFTSLIPITCQHTMTVPHSFIHYYIFVLLFSYHMQDHAMVFVKMTQTPLKNCIRPVKHDLLFLIIANMLYLHPHHSSIIGLFPSYDPLTHECQYH